MVIVAGPNGSGKSTLTNVMRGEEQFSDLDLLNPDEIGVELRRTGLHRILSRVPTLGWVTDWCAARAVTRRVARALDDGRSFIVETVLSTTKYVEPVQRARAAGYYIALYFVTLPSPDLNCLRVECRRRQGGHGVPEDKVRKRWERSHGLLATFGELADEVRVYDNSAEDGAPRLVVTKDKLRAPYTVLLHGVLPRVERALGA